MTIRMCCAVAAIALAASFASAQSTGDLPATQPSRVDASPFVRGQYPTVLRELNLSASDVLEAALSVEDKGAKLTYTPLLYGLVNYRPVISETRLFVSQANNITTFGVGTTYNPASPRAGRANEIWSCLTIPAFPLGYTQRLNRLAKAELAKIPPLQAQIQMLLGSQSPNDQKKLAELTADVLQLNTNAAAMKAEVARVSADFLTKESEVVRQFYEKLLESRTPVINGSFSTSLFAILGGTSVDADHDGLADTELKAKSRALALSVDFPFRRHVTEPKQPGADPSEPPKQHWRWLQLSVAATTEWQRGSQEESTPFARLFGFGVTGGGIVKILNPDYESTDDYKNDFFIPSVSLGVSFEGKLCTSDDKSLCPDKLDTQYALTPFVDVKVTKTAQFRIGVPIKRTLNVGGNQENGLGIVTAYTLQLGASK